MRIGWRIALLVPTLALLPGCEIFGIVPEPLVDGGVVEDGGTPHDGGVDAGEVTVDSGPQSMEDGGTIEIDGGQSLVDGGLADVDGGSPSETDAGQPPETDAGQPPETDGGMPPPPPDGGMPPPPPDGGMPPPPPDGGMPPPPPDGGMPPPPPDGGMPPPPPDGGMPPPPPDGGMPPPMDGGLATLDGGSASTCDLAWDQVTHLYADATQLTSCDGIPGATYIVSSLMNLDGITIDNNGTTMTPCLQTRCDSTYVYVATNALPHYDFVQTTPNPLKEVPYIYRVPMTTHVIGATDSALNATDINGCMSAYDAFASNPSVGTSSEVSGFCGNDGYYYDILADDIRDYHRRVPCLNTDAFLISGPPVFGPNEGPTPDPWGNPAYNWPNVAGETVTSGAQLDLCGGHTANSMHYHAMNQACFDLTGDGHPANSYVTATENWDYSALFTTDCTQESPIVGWSLDGYSIRGPCVCLWRNNDGSCGEVKRARSSWVYGGLSVWGTGATNLSVEAMTCGDTSDCCQGASNCRFKCSWSVFPDETAPGGTTADKRCVLIDYAWCTSQFVDRSGYDPAESNFIYMDRCNGYEGPDGYSYHATGSFPFLLGCYHGAPSDTVAGGNLGGGMMPPPDGGMMPPPDGGMMPPPDGGMPPPPDGGMPPPPDGGMMPPPDGGMMPPPDGGMMPPPDGGMPPPPDGGMLPTCRQGQTSMCCGDHVCDGPENHQNCATDCP